MNDQLQSSMQNVRKRFPVVDALNINAMYAPNKTDAYAEYYPPEELYNPTPGRHTVELHRPDMSPAQMEAVLAGDSLHAVPKVFPEAAQAKAGFIKSMHPAQLRVSQDMYKEAKARNPKDRRTFSEFLDQSAADAFIRDYVMQKMYPGFEKPMIADFPIMGSFFPDNIEPLERFLRFIQNPNIAIPDFQ
jgi:hypothetical protein